MNTSPEGGEYTVVNRLRCWLVGHSRADRPTVTTERYSAWLCTRCGNYAKLRDNRSEVWYNSFDEASAEAKRKGEAARNAFERGAAIWK